MQEIILFALKVSLIISLVLYVVFALIMSRQTHLLGSMLKTKVSPVLNLVPALFIFADAILLVIVVLVL